MDIGGSIQVSIFAYVLMAFVAMLAAVMVKGIVILLQQAGRKRVSAAATSVNISVTAAVDETAAHVAAVAAAVFAVLGAHRLVRIGEAARAPTWAITGRAAHHLSHAPRRTGR
jgi:hypothetical protein